MSDGELSTGILLAKRPTKAEACGMVLHQLGLAGDLTVEGYGDILALPFIMLPTTTD